MRNTEEREINKSYVHCPHCDKKWFTTVSAFDLNYKCDKCHRRYLDEDEVSINESANGKKNRSAVRHFFFTLKSLIGKVCHNSQSYLFYNRHKHGNGISCAAEKIIAFRA